MMSIFTFLLYSNVLFRKLNFEIEFLNPILIKLLSLFADARAYNQDRGGEGKGGGSRPLMNVRLSNSNTKYRN